MTEIDWESFENFSKEEFDCQETGENEMKHHFIVSLQTLRELCDFPFVISSGYRSPNHSIESAKNQPGTHAQGIACDILCFGERAHKLLQNALYMEFSGIGINQKGPFEQRFIHLDKRNTSKTVWSY